jgi:hypothetical protein
LKCAIRRDLLYRGPPPSSVLELNIEEDDGDDKWEDEEVHRLQDIIIVEDDEDSRDDL